MNIIQLKCFNTVAQIENMSKASALLHISQPAISKNIARLESELGCSLFERNGKSLKLNENGERLLKYSSEAMETLENGISQAFGLGTSNRQAVRIGIGAEYYRLWDCISVYSKNNPSVGFEIHNRTLEQELDINEYDVLIYPRQSSFEKFSGFSLGTEKAYIAVHSGKTGIKTLNDLSGCNIVYLKKDRTAEYQQQIIRALGIQSTADYYADSSEHKRVLISSGIGAGIINEGELPLYKSSDIKLIPLKDKRFSREIMIAFRKKKYLSEAALKFTDFAAEYFMLEKKPQEDMEI